MAASKVIKEFLCTVALSACVLQPCIAQDKLYANQFPLASVTLLNSPFSQARDLNIKVLLQYDADGLLAGYRKQAGLPSKAVSFKNWDGLDGHVAGHYLSALAMNFAATGNAECKARLTYILNELKLCQEANEKQYPLWGKGYLGAVPQSEKIWSNFKQGDFAAFRSAWVPFYNIHKMYSGLRDAWLYTGNTQAKTMFLDFCDWGINITEGLSEVQMQAVLDIEHGGMNEIYADAYQLTGEKKYLLAAKKFSHNMLLDAMAEGKDNLDNLHANTQIPKVIGFARIAELSNDEKFYKAANFFWQTVTHNRTLAFGGNSRREFFPTVASSTDYVTDVEGPESCNSYNMLKLTEDLFRLKPIASFIDYYERTLYNHILSTQHPQHGGYVYFTPARPQHYRVYSAPNQAMWCCVGSGMENHGKYNELIYTHSSDSLFVNLFIASQLDWKEKNIIIRQETNFPYQEGTTLKVVEGGNRLKLFLRYPGWVKRGALKVLVNGKAVAVNAQPSSFFVIDRLWKKNDVIEIALPMQTTLEKMPNVPDYIAMLHGPVVLAAKTTAEDLSGLVAGDGRWAQIPSGKKLPLNKAPIIISESGEDIIKKLKPVPGKPLHFTAEGLRMVNPVKTVFQPFYTLHDSRYMLYWMALNNNGYKSYLDSLAKIEEMKLDLEKRTVDFVAPGEQQPEADHLMEMQHSAKGNFMDAFWRDAKDGGYFSYQLATGNQKNLSLLVRYWGAEWGNRKFEIYIDDQKLVSEDNTGKWNQSAFKDVQYSIPDTIISGKQNVRVKFQSLKGSTAGAVYSVRLVRDKPQANNPVIFADVPDLSMIRVGSTYYMSSTTMHMSPGVPIMRSTDLVNWKLISYAYDTLADIDEVNMNNGKNIYGRGSWASCLRYHNGNFYLSTFSQKPDKTFIFVTKDIEKGPWKRISFSPSYHDHTIFFDDDGKIYLIAGAGKLRIFELKEDLSGVKPGSEKILIENASTPSGTGPGLPAEGSQLFKVNGKYYLFNISWPRGGMRTVLIHRADKITGPWEGRVALQDLGVAQGGLIDMPDGTWYSYLFRDYGAVGRIPYLVPVKWEDGWPVLGIDGKVPEHFNLPANKSLIPGIVDSDEFTRKKSDAALPLVWQWNHNPDNKLWSVTERKGFLRLKTGRTDTSFVTARNTLTQRTIGPVCSATTLLDVSNLKDGDVAGFGLLQKNYGFAGVRVRGTSKFIVMVNAGTGKPEEVAALPLNQQKIYLKAQCDFTNRRDTAEFFYSLDGKSWEVLGTPLKMSYTLPHFMGYRFSLFCYATKNTGGFADFDYFRIADAIDKTKQ